VGKFVPTGIYAIEYADEFELAPHFQWQSNKSNAGSAIRDGHQCDKIREQKRKSLLKKQFNIEHANSNDLAIKWGLI
jgi:hypothetical protein